jgi:glycosyltransferase involved in cell wall biosynthesis
VSPPASPTAARGAQPAAGEVAQPAGLPRDIRRDFAVIVPAYNEVESVPALFRALRETFTRHGLTGEVIFVDDGSTDGTFEAAAREGSDFQRLTILRHRRNRGKTEALVTGAAATRGEFVILFDADLQHSTEEIPRYLTKLAEGWDIVTGRKVGPYEKRAVSSIYNWLSTNLFDVPVSDLNSMKAFRRQILDDVPLRHDWHRFFVVLAHAQGYSVTEIDIELHPRRVGTSKYSGRGRVLVGVGDLVVVWFYLKFSQKPMQLFGGTGLVLIALGLLVGLIAIVLRVAGWMPPFGYRPLLTLVLLLETVGFMLFGFGFIAELIAILRTEVEQVRRRGRPE